MSWYLTDEDILMATKTDGDPTGLVWASLVARARGTAHRITKKPKVGSRGKCFCSRPFPVTSYIWQSCTMSMILFTLTMNPLLFMWDQHLASIRCDNVKQTVSVVAYADDFILPLTNEQELNVALQLTRTYAGATGARLNWRKSKSLAVGSWDT